MDCDPKMLAFVGIGCRLVNDQRTLPQWTLEAVENTGSQLLCVAVGLFGIKLHHFAVVQDSLSN